MTLLMRDGEQVFSPFEKGGWGDFSNAGFSVHRTPSLVADPQDLSLTSHDYRPFKRLLVPRYILPNLALIDGAVFASAMISGICASSRSDLRRLAARLLSANSGS